MGSVQSRGPRTFDSSTFESIVECRVESSQDDASEIWFETAPITESLLADLATIQLKTVSHNENSIGPTGELENSWFELVLYRSWKRAEPRFNLATKKEFAWRSHANKAYPGEEYAEQAGTPFKQGDEMFKEIEPGDVIAARVCAKGAVNYAITGKIVVTFKDEGELLFLL
jgi:hypothetical protein